LASSFASVCQASAPPAAEYSMTTLPGNPCARQRISKLVVCGIVSPPLGLVTRTNCAGLFDACAVLPYATLM
jgi:hypothetical protein